MDTQLITVPIPADRVPDFYVWFGQWLGGQANAQALADGTVRPPQTQRSDWAPDDGELVAEYVGKLSAAARAVFKILLELPSGQRIRGEELGALAAIPHGRYGVAGVMAWPGRHAYATGRCHPIQFEETAETSWYWMEPEVVRLFKRVLT